MSFTGWFTSFQIHLSILNHTPYFTLNRVWNKKCSTSLYIPLYFRINNRITKRNGVIILFFLLITQFSTLKWSEVKVKFDSIIKEKIKFYIGDALNRKKKDNDVFGVRFIFTVCVGLTNFLLHLLHIPSSFFLRQNSFFHHLLSFFAKASSSTISFVHHLLYPLPPHSVCIFQRNSLFIWTFLKKISYLVEEYKPIVDCLKP